MQRIFDHMLFHAVFAENNWTTAVKLCRWIFKFSKGAWLQIWGEVINYMAASSAFYHNAIVTKSVKILRLCKIHARRHWTLRNLWNTAGRESYDKKTIRGCFYVSQNKVNCYMPFLLKINKTIRCYKHVRKQTYHCKTIWTVATSDFIHHGL